MQHSPVGLIQIYRNDAFSNFDILQVVNTFQENDLKEINEIKNKKIRPWKSKYLFLSKKINFNSNFSQKDKISVIIAPTWGTNFFSDNIYLSIDEILSKDDYLIHIRPHIMSYKNHEIEKNTLIRKNFIISEGSLNFNNYDVLISDWSGIYIEYAKINKKKAILIETEPKILNEKFYEYKNQSIDFFARNKIGNVVELKDIRNLDNIIKNNLKNEIKNQKDIENFFNMYFFK